MIGTPARDLQPLWNRFLLVLSQVLHLGQLHEPTNANMAQPVDHARRLLEEIAQGSSELVVQAHDATLFVNHQRIRADGISFEKHRAFSEYLAIRGIGGLRFREALDADAWGRFILALARHPRDSKSPFDGYVLAIGRAGLAPAVELLPLESAPSRPPLEPRAFAVRAYAKAMAVVREFMATLEDAARTDDLHRKLMRAVQDLVTVACEHGWRYFGLVNNKHFEEYLSNHSVNVCVLSLMMGIPLRLSRAQLYELGMAAILHDLGKALLPARLMEKSIGFTEAERLQMMRHPELGVRALLRLRPYSEIMLRRILVLCEHHEGVRESNAHLYSRIVAVAEVFDALTTDRPHRKAYRPEVAVKMLMTLAGDRLDRDLTMLFVQRVGLFPCGTLVELSGGEIGIVFHPAEDPAMWMCPVVKLVKGADGIPYRIPPEVDLSAEARQEGGRHIVRSIPPEPLGINVAGWLYAGAG